MQEELFEEGVVLKSSGGIAEIALKENSNCEECTAKIFCSPLKNNLRTLTVSDPFKTMPGDQVKVSIKGYEVLKASLLLYGVPLILIIIGIIIGMSLFEGLEYYELYAFVCGLILTGIYFILFYIKASFREKMQPLSIIIAFRRNN